MKKTSAYLDISLDHCLQLEGDRENFMDWSTIKVRKLNKTHHGLIGNLTHRVPLDNSYEGQLTIFIKQGGEYRKLPYRLPKKNYCDYIKDDTYFYPELAASSISRFLSSVPKKTWVKLKTLNIKFINLFSEDLQSLRLRAIIKGTSTRHHQVRWICGGNRLFQEQHGSVPMARLCEDYSVLIKWN